MRLCTSKIGCGRSYRSALKRVLEEGSRIGRGIEGLCGVILLSARQSITDALKLRLLMIRQLEIREEH